MSDIKFTKDNSPIVLIGDVIDRLHYLKDNNIQVDTIITSPPYWGQRDYGIKGQIGNEADHDSYIKKMLDVADALKPVLKDTGSYFLNIGDKYAGKGLSLVPYRLAIAMADNGWVLRNIITWYKPNHMPSSIKDRLANTYEPIFFFVKATGNKYSPRYYADIDGIRIPHNGTNGNNSIGRTVLSIEEFKKLGKQALLDNNEHNGNGNYNGKFTNADKINMGASPGARKSVNGEYWSLQRKYEIDNEVKKDILSHLKEKRKELGLTAKQIDKEFGYKDTAGHWFRLDRGGSLPKVQDWSKLKNLLNLDDKYDKMMTEQHYVLQTVSPHEKGKNPGDFWSMATEKLTDSHFAIFPSELPRRIIKGFCPKDGIVLDPFVGSGTTLKVAKELNRKSIGIELNKNYLKIIKKRCGKIITLESI